MEKEQMDLEWMGCPESEKKSAEYRASEGYVRDHYLQEEEELMQEQKRKFAEALIPETPNTDMLMISGARQAVVQALEGKNVEGLHLYRQELIEALKAQGDADKTQQSFICIADTYANDAQRFEHAREQALAYAAGFWRGQGVVQRNRKLARQHLDSLEHSQEFAEKDDWVNQHSLGMIAGIKKSLSSVH